jgi:hypothetical protein
MKKTKQNKKNHTVGTFLKSNKEIVERGKIDTSNSAIHDHALPWLVTVISINYC